MSFITGFDYLRLVLLLGLIGHKLIWEALKRKVTHPTTRPPSIGISKRLIKTAKAVILIFLVIQTAFLNILPISAVATSLQIAGIALFLVGLAVAILGRVQLDSNWKDVEDLEIANTRSLTTGGIYRFIRHPIYAGDMLLLIGLELALNSWLVLGMIAPILVFARQAVAEEGTLARQFPGYASYRLHTKRFIPFVI